ncbi:MAG: transposase [Candidatus Competibacteraceae bacterium]|nr:transposase [Candidatus Competibacteraceae bacterium]
MPEPRRQYLPSFKDEAIRLVLEHGYTCDRAGEQLGVPPKTLANWVRPHRKQRQATEVQRGVEQDDPTALRARITELQKRLRQAEMEREILKKATAFFAKENP